MISNLEPDAKGPEMKDFTVLVLLAVAILCTSCGHRSSSTDQNADSRSPEQIQRQKDIDQSKILYATLTLEKLEQQRGDYDECMKKMDEIARLYGEQPTRHKSTNHAADANEPKHSASSFLTETNSSSSTVEVDPVTQVYRLVPELRRVGSLGEGFLQRYESRGERPDSSSSNANELCQQFFNAGDEAGKLNTGSGELSCLNKNYSDAIEQLHPVLVEANSKMKQVLALGLTCH